MSTVLQFRSGKRYRIPRSSYYFGPPVDTSVYGTDPIGHIGEHHPREIIRIERDYSGGELVQFSPAYPLELEGRVRFISRSTSNDVDADADINLLVVLGDTDTISRSHQHHK